MAGRGIPNTLSPSTPLMEEDSRVAANATARYGLAFRRLAHAMAIKMGRKKNTAPLMESSTI